jgi:hypothetical protein
MIEGVDVEVCEGNGVSDGCGDCAGMGVFVMVVGSFEGMASIKSLRCWHKNYARSKGSTELDYSIRARNGRMNSSGFF